MKRELIARRKRIALAYAVALGDDFANPLPRVWAIRAVRAVMPDVTESEIFAAVRWGIGQSKRSGARFERRRASSEAGLAAGKNASLHRGALSQPMTSVKGARPMMQLTSEELSL